MTFSKDELKQLANCKPGDVFMLKVEMDANSNYRLLGVDKSSPKIKVVATKKKHRNPMDHLKNLQATAAAY